MSDLRLSSPPYDVADAFAANELFQECLLGYPFVVIEHPIANDCDEEMRQGGDCRSVPRLAPQRAAARLTVFPPLGMLRGDLDVVTPAG